jgi:hypothetical protein
VLRGPSCCSSACSIAFVEGEFLLVGAVEGSADGRVAVLGFGIEMRFGIVLGPGSVSGGVGT